MIELRISRETRSRRIDEDRPSRGSTSNTSPDRVSSPILISLLRANSSGVLRLHERLSHGMISHA